jgi:hypothetical protein
VRQEKLSIRALAAIFVTHENGLVYGSDAFLTFWLGELGQRTKFKI